MKNYRLTPLRDTAKNKERIIEQTRRSLEQQVVKTSKKQRPVVPVLIAACVFVLSLFLAGPSIYQAFFKEQHFTVEKVVFPQSAHDALYHAVYIDATNEFIYKKQDGFYSFDVEAKQETQLVATSGQMSYSYEASQKWIVWGEVVNDEQKMHVLNRETNEIIILETDYFFDVQLHGDDIIYMEMKLIDASKSETNYIKYNLLTEQSMKIREHEVTSNSKASIFDGNYMAVSEQVKMDNGKETIIAIQDLQQAKDIRNYTLPYDIVQKITLLDKKLYAYVWDSDDKAPGEISVIDIETNEYTKLKSPVMVDDYATDGQYFAISVQKGDSNSVQLFEEQEGQLKRVSSLPTIRERLVLPRFTEEGTLVVTSEGPERPIYLIRFK